MKSQARKLISAMTNIAILTTLISIPSLSVRAQEIIGDKQAFFDFAERARSGESVDAVLDSDIDLEGTEFEPIPAYDGVFDGGGHTISGLRIVIGGGITERSLPNSAVRSRIWRSAEAYRRKMPQPWLFVTAA